MEFIVRNFKSIKETKLDLARINVFIGPPNSGKSNLLEAIYLYGIKKRYELWSNSGIPYSIEYLERKIIRGLETNVRSIFRDFDPKNIIFIRATGYFPMDVSLREDDILINNRKIEEEPDELEDFPLTILYRYENFITTSDYNLENIDYLLPDFRNLNYIITKRYPKIYIDLKSTFESQNNENKFQCKYGICIVIEKNKFKLLDTVSGKTYPLSDLKNVAQSIQYYILFSTAILSSEYFSQEYKTETICLLEEPDAHVYPILIEEFIDLLKEKIKYTNIVLTTHNNNTLLMLMDRIPKDKLRVFGVIRGEKGYTEIKELKIEKLRKMVIEYGANIIRNLEYYIEDLKI